MTKSRQKVAPPSKDKGGDVKEKTKENAPKNDLASVKKSLESIKNVLQTTLEQLAKIKVSALDINGNVIDVWKKNYLELQKILQLDKELQEIILAQKPSIKENAKRYEELRELENTINILFSLISDIKNKVVERVTEMQLGAFIPKRTSVSRKSGNGTPWKQLTLETLKSDPSRLWTPKEIANVLREKGYNDPKIVARIHFTLQSLASRGIVELVDSSDNVKANWKYKLIA